MESRYRNTEWLEISESPYDEPTFHQKLRIEEKGTKEWTLLTPFTYTTLVLGHPLAITARMGFTTDLSSIPRLFQSLVPKVSRHRRASIPHDVLYHEAGLHPLTQAQVDAIFLEAMEAANVPWLRRRAMYTALRVGGWVQWSKQVRRNTRQ